MEEALKPAVIANTVRMLREGAPERAICLVEGEDDSKFYKTVLDSARCHTIPCYGFPRVLEVLSRLQAESFAGIVAVVDADFGRLESREATGNVVWTDSHDLETDLIASSAFDKLAGHLCDDERLRGFCAAGDLRQILLKSVAPLGYLRWLNHRREYHLKFKNIEYGDFVDRDTLAIDDFRMVKAVLDKSNRHDLKILDIVAELETIRNPSHNLLWLCRGHDVMEVFSIGLRRCLARRDPKDIRRELLERDLRLAYERPEFASTRLHGSLRGWEKGSGLFRVLPA